MKFSRSSCLIAVIALLSMLFMQLAVAAYTCPATATENHTVVMMPGCEGMDEAQPGLCYTHAHGQPDEQSADNLQLPAISPFISIGLVLAVYMENNTVHETMSPDLSTLARTTAPPIAIRHCCFRI